MASAPLAQTDQEQRRLLRTDLYDPLRHAPPIPPPAPPVLSDQEMLAAATVELPHHPVGKAVSSRQENTLSQKAILSATANRTRPASGAHTPQARPPATDAAHYRHMNDTNQWSITPQAGTPAADVVPSLPPLVPDLHCNGKSHRNAAYYTSPQPTDEDRSSPRSREQASRENDPHR